MGSKTAPYRYDIVGSFLRSRRIKQAREAYEEGKLTQEELKVVEDQEIEALVSKEKEAGLLAVTDGEYRRAFWHLDFLWNLDGVTRTKAKHFSVAFKGFQPKAETLVITGKLDFPQSHPFLTHFSFLQSISGQTQAKQCIPSPSMLHLICCVREPNYVPIPQYIQEQAFLDDLAVTYQKAILAFYGLGCRYLQFDDTSWGELCSMEKRESYKKRGIDVDSLAQKYVYVINKALEVKPKDMTVTMHICRGNFRSTWSSSGSYEPVAEILFGGCNVDGFFLEYDSERAGDFKPLRFIKGQKVVLGLITSKTAALEDKATIIARIHEAARYVPLEQLSLSPQCGFASTEEGNLLSEQEQWAKIALVKEISQEVWNNENRS